MNGLCSLLIRAVLTVVVLAACAAPAVAQEVVEYIHTDALGSPVAITDASGNVIERTVYEPYGAVVNRPLKDGPGYTGHVTDSGTGLSYMQQRYYDSGLGVFLSVDPISASSSMFGRYFYGNNSPYRFVDPDGRASEEKSQRRSAVVGSKIKNGMVAPGSRMGTLGAANAASGSNGSYGREPRASDPEWTRDPKVKGQMESAWNDSNPFAPAVRRGESGSLKRENGGWIVQFVGEEGHELVRSPAGTRDRMSVESTRKPSEFECGCIVKGYFHTHPNTRAEGYFPGTNGYDYEYQLQQGVPGMIRGHEGYEFIPIPGGR
ncbi:RHS repeat domain-containing protein [Stenotrophomonas geniculata]